MVNVPAAIVYSHLRSAGVGETIARRVERMNSEGVAEGEICRGIYRRPDPRMWRDCVTKGFVIRRFGREAFDATRRQGRFKNGKRVYVLAEALVEALNA